MPVIIEPSLFRARPQQDGACRLITFPDSRHSVRNREKFCFGPRMTSQSSPVAHNEVHDSQLENFCLSALRVFREVYQLSPAFCLQIECWKCRGRRSRLFEILDANDASF